MMLAIKPILRIKLAATEIQIIKHNYFNELFSLVWFLKHGNKFWSKFLSLAVREQQACGTLGIHRGTHLTEHEESYSFPSSWFLWEFVLLSF